MGTCIHMWRDQAPSLDDVRYVVTFLDAPTCRMLAYPLEPKAKVFDMFKERSVIVEDKIDARLQCLWSENDGNLCSDVFVSYCVINELQSEMCVPVTTLHIGIEERMIRMAMLHASSMRVISKTVRWILCRGGEHNFLLLNHGSLIALDFGYRRKI